MKKATLALAAILMIANSTNAQDRSTRLGLQVSPNLAWVTTDAENLDGDGQRLGYRFGLLGDFQLGSNANYFFSTGAFLNNVGAKLKATLPDSAKTVLTSEASYQYVELPVTIKLKTNEIGYLTYFAQIGFDAGIMVAAKVKTGQDTKFKDNSDNSNLLRLSLSVGAGAEYNFSGNTSLLMGLRYSNGFTDVNSDEANAPSPVKLHYFELTVGALF
jgi:opacity protein-like surface antigen